jgi:hypothetical protein
MNIHEKVRAKNVDLLVQSYNREVNKMVDEGFINPASKEVKALKNRYENLLARFDTDKNTKKDGKGYKYKIPLDSKNIKGLKGIRPTISIEEE